MQIDPHVPLPEGAVKGEVLDMEVVQDHYWPEGQAVLKRFVAALAAIPIPPATRELVRLRTAALTGCTH